VTISPRQTLDWKKSSACTATANCIEVAALPGGGNAVRDSKDPQSPELRFTAPSWSQFITAVRAGEFNPASRS
jgi:hypothetical protein